MRSFPLLLASLLLAACAHVAPPAPANTVVLVSVDALPASLVGTGLMPTLDGMANNGVQAAWLTPSYPTQTFPNHYTLVTGLRPDHHGIVHNNIRDATLGTFISKSESAADGRWWGGEPIWATLQKQGGIAATMFWPGSEAEIAGQRPRYYVNYDKKVSIDARVDRVLAWLDLPAGQRPGLVTLYLEQYDVIAHETGAYSEEALAALREVDAGLGRLRDGLQSRGLLASTNMIVLSDHGMITIRPEDVRYLDDLVPADAIDMHYAGPMAGLAPTPGNTRLVETALLGRHDHYECWRKQDLPRRWAYGHNPRIPPIICQPDPGWLVRVHASVGALDRQGNHSYAPESPEMRAAFVATGPDFIEGTQLPAFDNVDVYPLLARLLRITPAANDGTLAPLVPALRHTSP